MKILRIGLIDDETSTRNLLTEIISMIPGYSIEFSTGNPHDALEYALDTKIDILITDIMMPELGGLELTRRIAHLPIPVILCSAHDKFGVEGFRLDAVHFVMKPPAPSEVSEALKRARKSLQLTIPQDVKGEEDYVLIKEHGENKQLVIKPMDILYMEQKERFTLISMDTGKTIKTRSEFFNTLKKINQPYIFRIHRSFAVNFMKIEALEPTICHLIRGSKIPIGKEFKAPFQAFLKSKTVI